MSRYPIVRRLAPMLLFAAILFGCDDNTTPSITLVRLSAAPDSLFVNDTVRLEVQVLAGTATEVRHPDLIWAISDTVVALVDSSGLVTARSPGSATLTVTAGGLRDSAVVRVVSRDRLIVWIEAPDAALTSPSTLVRLRLVGAMPPQFVSYQINSEPEKKRVLFSCDAVDLCGFYASGLPEGRSTITVSIEAAGRIVRGEAEVTVNTRSLSYAVKFTGNLGEANSFPVDINERGWVVGNASATWPRVRPFVYDGGTTRELIGTNEMSSAVAINESGVVVGNMGGGAPCYNSIILWDAEERMTTLKACTGRAQDITDEGAVVMIPSGLTVQVVDGSSVRDVPISSLGCWSFPERARISNAGTVAVGGRGHCKGPGVGAIQDNTPFHICVRSYCDLGGINDSGTIVISSHTYYRHPHELYLWRNGSHTHIGSHNADTNARAINNKNEILAMDRGIPVLWRAGVFYEIRPTDPTWVIDNVVEINDAGQIAAHAKNLVTGEVGAVRLDPIR